MKYIGISNLEEWVNQNVSVIKEVIFVDMFGNILNEFEKGSAKFEFNYETLKYELTAGKLL